MKGLAVVQPILAGAAILLVVAGAIADPSMRTTKITFSGSVRVPGAVLNAGTYYFKAPLRNNRTFVRIQDEQGKMVAQFMGIADYTHKSDHVLIIFGDHECGPKTIKSWFYPSSSPGVRFVYSKDEAAVIAASCDEDVPETHENTLDESQLQSATVYLMTPQKQEEPYRSEALTASDQQGQNGFDADAQK
jgi:hypothetical protein